MFLFFFVLFLFWSRAVFRRVAVIVGKTEIPCFSKLILSVIVILQEFDFEHLKLLLGKRISWDGIESFDRLLRAEHVVSGLHAVVM